MKLLIVIAAIFALPLAAQTKVAPRQITCISIGSTLFNVPTCVQLGTGLALNTSTTPPTLNVTSAATYVFGEVPTGSINGTNTVFTLANAPVGAAIFVNGLRMTGNIDYSISGTTITFASESIPQSGDLLVVDYTHN